MRGYTIQHSIDLLEKKVDQGSGGGSSSASDITYDNTTSGLSSTSVQGAIDELDGSVDTLSTQVTNLANRAIGVFFDSSNVIQAKTDISTSATYTATEDCIVQTELVIPASSSASVLSDNIALFSLYVSGLQTYVMMFYVPAGKTITINGGSSGQTVSNYTVYGIYEPTSNSRSRKKK